MKRAEFNSQRRRALQAATVVLMVEIAMLAGPFLSSVGRMRSFILVLGSIFLGLSLVSIVALIAAYRQISKKIDND